MMNCCGTNLPADLCVVVLLAGTITTYDKHGSVKWVGHVQMVEGLTYAVV